MGRNQSVYITPAVYVPKMGKIQTPMGTWGPRVNCCFSCKRVRIFLSKQICVPLQKANTNFCLHYKREVYFAEKVSTNFCSICQCLFFWHTHYSENKLHNLQHTPRRLDNRNQKCPPSHLVSWPLKHNKAVHRRPNGEGGWTRPEKVANRGDGEKHSIKTDASNVLRRSRPSETLQTLCKGSFVTHATEIIR